MANENNYFEFLDIPDGNGGTERWYASDAEARAAIAQLDPASVIEVADITALTSAQVEALVVGGAVNKSDSTGKHSYRVTYKSSTGCCLTYYDAENIETVAYDKENDAWTYTDTTITAIADKADKATTLAGYGITDAYTKTEVDTALEGKSDTNHTHSDKADKVTGATSGNLAALDASGNLVDSGKSGSLGGAAYKGVVSTVNNSTDLPTAAAVKTAIEEALINPISDSSITKSSSFNKRDLVNVDGTMYLCDNATTEYPKMTPVTSGSDLVECGGDLVIIGNTASSDWHSI